jgi:LysR family nitrogen assimilation transcriptional regulator
MQLLDLQRFVEVAEHGSLSKAAAASNKSQAFMSRQIKEFEAEIGAALFRRTGRGVELNEAGDLLLARAKRILEEYEAAGRDLRALSDTQISEASIALPTVVARQATSKLTEVIFEEYPHLKLQLIENLSGPILEMVMARKVDIAILYDNVSVRRAAYDQICEEEMYLVQHANKGKMPPVMPVRALENVPLILPSLGSGLRGMIESAAQQAEIKLSARMEADTVSMIQQLVESDFGSAILPITAVRREVQKGILTASKLVEPRLKRNLLITACSARLPASPLNKLARTVKRVIQECLGEG